MSTPAPKVTVVDPAKVDPPKVETPAAGADDTAAKLVALEARAAAAEAKVIERETADKKAREKRMADDGKTKELLELTQKERDETAAKLKTYEDREAVRVAGIEKTNAAALKALPDAVRKLAPVGLDVDAMSEWLTNAAALAKDAEERPAGGMPRGVRGGGEPHPDAVTYATARRLDPVTVHNSFVAAGRLPKDVKPIPVA